MQETVKMYGPSISDPSKIVNRDVPMVDVRAYEAVGYKRGSIEEMPEEEAKPAEVFLGSIELPEEEPELPPEPAKTRKRKSK